MDYVTVWTLVILALISLMVAGFFVIRCLTQGKECQSVHRIEGKCILITGADTPVGIELVREMCKRGAERVIMACDDVQIGQDVAVEIRGETNGDIIVEHCDMACIRSVREFTTKILESEQRIHILINNASVMWMPLRRTVEGHEYHWGYNHLASFVMTQLMMPLLLRGAPDARVITLSSAWHKHGVIHWDDPDYAQPQHRKYRASEAYSQSKLANVLFTRELARRLEGTGVNAYCVNPGLVPTGLGWHIVPGLGCFGTILAGAFWLPWLTSPENGIQTVVHCATEPTLTEQSGFYYSDCSVQLTSEKGSDMDDAYRMWEMSERMAGLTS